MSAHRNAIAEEFRRAVRALLAKGIRPDAAIAERVGCSVYTVRAVRAEDRKAAKKEAP